MSEDQIPVKEYVYLAAMMFEDGSETVVDLEERGWAEPTRLALVKRFTLIPKDGVDMPVVSVQIPDDCKPVFKTRVFGVIGMSSGDSQSVMRCYAVGYHCKGGAETLTWVLPNGCIEVGADPLLAGPLFRHLKSQM